MAGFIYFIPGVTKQDAVDHTTNHFKEEFLREWSLASVLKDCTDVPGKTVLQQCRHPEAGDGITLYPKPTVGDLPIVMHVDLKLQDWCEASDGSKRLIGWFKADPPTANELQRHELVGVNYSIKDERGEIWHPVTARSRDDHKVTLPAHYVYRDGKITPKIKPQYQSLWELSGVVWNHFKIGLRPDLAGENEQCQSDEWMVMAAITALSENYRIGLGELNALYECGRGFDEEMITKICSCLIDNPKLNDFDEMNEADSKKNHQPQDSLSVSHGAEESCQDTTQLEPTSK